MSIAAHVHNRDRKVCANITKYRQPALRKIAAATGLSKTSVARSIETVTKRNQYPESHFWETAAGQEWLRRMVIAMLYEFGVKGNQGAERMSEFLKRLRVDSHVGVSPTALRTMKRVLETELAKFQREQEVGQKGTAVRQIVAAGDETWLGEKLLLVLMDLGSGYLVMEEEAADRSYETWQSKGQARLQEIGVKVKHFVSDRAKALIKLATSSFGTLAGADIFHAQHAISQWLGRSLYGKKGRAGQQLQEAEAKKAELEGKKAPAEKLAAQARCIEACQEKLNEIDAGKEAYNKVQQTVSAAVHAFSVADNTAQSSEQVERQLAAQAQRFAQLAQAQSVSDNKDAVGKCRRQIEDVSSVVDAWWQWTTESLTEGQPTAELTQWLLSVLLPVIYWDHQLHKTQNPEMKKLYEKAWRAAPATYATHPVTPTLSPADLEHWRSWAEWASSNFHRASSAVEGRNGVLSQSYRNGRSLSRHKLAALTAIHNYDTHRRDGSTPAERLYGQQFPDLFEWLLGQMEALPLPRKARQHVVSNPLSVGTVPP